MVLLVIYHAELSWRHTMYGLVGMHQILAIGYCLKCAMQTLWRMTNLKSNLPLSILLPIIPLYLHCFVVFKLLRQEMKVINTKLLFVSRGGVISIRDL